MDRFKHDNLKIPKEKLEKLSLSGNDYVGHVKPKQSKEKPPARDNLKLATGKLEDLTTSNTDFKVGSKCSTTADVHVTDEMCSYTYVQFFVAEQIYGLKILFSR